MGVDLMTSPVKDLDTLSMLCSTKWLSSYHFALSLTHSLPLTHTLAHSPPLARLPALGFPHFRLDGPGTGKC